MIKIQKELDVPGNNNNSFKITSGQNLITAVSLPKQGSVQTEHRADFLTTNVTKVFTNSYCFFLE